MGPTVDHATLERPGMVVTRPAVRRGKGKVQDTPVRVDHPVIEGRAVKAAREAVALDFIDLQGLKIGLRIRSRPQIDIPFPSKSLYGAASSAAKSKLTSISTKPSAHTTNFGLRMFICKPSIYLADQPSSDAPCGPFALNPS